MLQDIKITVIGKQEDEEPIIVKALGNYIGNDDSDFSAITIKYQQEEEDESITHNTLFLSDDSLILKKSGVINSEMSFQMGKDTHSILKFGTMELEMGIKTKHFVFVKGEESLIIELIYDLYISDTEALVNHLEIIVESV